MTHNTQHNINIHPMVPNAIFSMKTPINNAIARNKRIFFFLNKSQKKHQLIAK